VNKQAFFVSSCQELQHHSCVHVLVNKQAFFVSSCQELQHHSCVHVLVNKQAFFVSSCQELQHHSCYVFTFITATDGEKRLQLLVVFSLFSQVVDVVWH